MVNAFLFLSSAFYLIELCFVVSFEKMPTSNPVYQPTTVTYERHSPDNRKEWPSNYITERIIPSCYQKPYLQRLLLISSILLAILGLSLAIYALVNDVNTHKDDPENEPMPTFDDNSEEDFEKEDAPDGRGDGSHDHQMNVVLGSIGICLVLIALVMYVMFLKLRGMLCRGLLPTHHSPARLAVNVPPRQQVHGDGSPTAVSYKGVQVISSHFH